MSKLTPFKRKELWHQMAANTWLLLDELRELRIQVMFTTWKASVEIKKERYHA